MSARMPGGLGDDNEADTTVHEICKQVRPEVEAKNGQKFEEFTPIVYKTQLVNGINYFIKVRVSDGQYVHIRTHKAFSGEITFFNLQNNKTLEEVIQHFQ